MKKSILISIISLILGGCAAKCSNEMQEIAHDVINKNRGVSITFTPENEKK